jgi:hypothetical protein
MKRVVLGLYALCVVVFAIYGNWWGTFAYKGFAYNLGRALIWPAIILPGVGKIIGVAILIAFILFVLSRRD